MIKGITVTLTQKVKSGVDGFNNPIYREDEVSVTNVLVTPSTSEDIVDTLNRTGKKAVYTLCIPKGDTHDWENTSVQFNGKKYQTIGQVKRYIDENVPLKWNDQIQVSNYE